ncbi:hypothetical protein [Clostridium sp. SM-530-WT-3G]|uniref:hypothetical protein n=1 Tax=Clostridium sp. SM-530-WT-3G TaxID=2725303 RepID=UPI00145CE913|nr:hypothetical protein [Clostridium sp. SM-530-WT-3G]NME82656.1 hypothetical protein [Clostridium sp. SM-530-WT-3G]
MKIRIIIVILILISFLNIGAFSGNFVNEYSFDELETECLSKSEFVENGVKIQYKTKTDKDTEKNKIINYFKTIKLNQNNINALNFVNNTLNVETNIWDDDLYTYVNVTLLNTDVFYKTLELQNIVGELIDENSEEVQCFCYYKGRINYTNNLSNTEILEEIMSESILNKADILEVNNGYTGNIILKSSEKINFAVSRYNTGTYFIIGTPIIFAAY